MHVKRRRLSNFEACSVALFTSLALGGAALAARSQTPSTHSVTSTTSTARSAPRSALANAPQVSPPKTSGSIQPNNWPPQRLAQAFRRSDDHGDGQLSRQEGSARAGLSRHFDQIDTNKDGSISSAGFDEALK